MPGPNTEILIVDDSPTIRATIAKYLGDEYITHNAVDGEEGWEMLQMNECISLVFCDIHMPVMNGMLLLQKIRESNCERIANVPVIMITGHDDTVAAKKATHNIGATDFIGKPFDKIDILSRAKSYTNLNKQINELEKKAAFDTLTGLYSNRMLLDFGNKTLSFAERHNMAASILFVEIADTQDLLDKHGKKTTETIISTVADVLEKSLRKEELVSHVEGGKFAAVLPNTKAFKAHIVATRLKQTVENLIFDINSIKLHVSLAVGLCSIQGHGTHGKLAFEEYCVQAAHALAASLETPNNRITRYDETYEKKVDDEKNTNASSARVVTDLVVRKHDSDSVENDQDSKEVDGDYLANILTGDYSTIPAEILPTLIEPLENFLEYARDTVNDGKKEASSE
jgi:diguanylate cyclase (GGDEF)-like protein